MKLRIRTTGRVLAAVGLTLVGVTLVWADSAPAPAPAAASVAATVTPAAPTVAVATTTAKAVTSAPSPVHFAWSGWTQLRYNWFDKSLHQANQFTIKRARLKYAGIFDQEGDSMALQIDLAKLADRETPAADPFGRRVVLKQAEVTHPFNAESSVRLGLDNIPWGIEVDKGDDWRLALERSHVADAFFPDQKEVGAYYFYTPTHDHGATPELALGYTNGQVDWGNASYTTENVNGGQVSAITANDTNDFAYVARAKWNLPYGGIASLSYINARRDRFTTLTSTGGNGPSTWYDQTCFTPSLRWCTKSHLNLMAEYYTGKILSVDNKGWYAQLDYTPGLQKLTPYLRYEEYNDGKAGDLTYKQDTLGVAYNSTKMMRETLEWDHYTDQKDNTYNNVSLQWQFSYGG